MIRFPILPAAVPLVLGSLVATTAPADSLPVPPAEFERLHALSMPQPGESPWRQITWLTNVTEARLRSVAENKPIVIFTAADGSPLGRT